ncbi:hypothetical protein RGQ29_016763 [Quercus rubra]|uniref:Uncharacterized protein n=1 Tax=Quercus rubra TaxID=3512 RepID=A0AAN7FFF5_QUERU|nr:hypothetical protein RGQ29_016763 [Quercus rubra]
MVGNLALSLSAKAVALGFEFGRGVLCEHEAANMSIGGKELNLMVSLTTSASTSSPNISRYFITSIIV